MPGFRPRSNKKISKKSTVTLDIAHKNKLKQFKTNDEELPNLIERKKELINLLNTEQEYNKKQEYLKEYNSLKNKIKLIKREKNDYYLNNSKYIFNYFQEKKDNINDENKEILYNFFYNNNKNKQKTNISQQTDIKRYLKNTTNEFNLEDFMISTEKCSICKKGELILVESEGVKVCKECNCIQQYLIDQDKPTYKEPPKEISFFAYKRINHFREILAQFQAKESTKIEPDVLDNIKKQIKKQRISLDNLTNDKMKSILKILGYNKYYEHVPFIKEKLGIKPPVMPIQLEQKLCNLFMEIQQPYAKFCPNKRVNFLNYYYVLYKLCELLDEDSYLKHFYLLKDPLKRMEQDEIWKKICGELNWEFIPTP
jgi:hypothetical protein